MAKNNESIDAQIRQAERHLRNLKKKKPLQIGNYILDNFKVTDTKENGDPKQDKNGNPLRRQLHNVNEFKLFYRVIGLIDQKKLDFGIYMMKKLGLKDLKDINHYIHNNGDNSND